MKKLSKGLALTALLLALFYPVELYPVERSDPTPTAELELPGDLRPSLQKACYDCHSQATHWPLYSYVNPISWLVVERVRQARASLNFSNWNSYKPAEQRDLRRRLAEMLDQGLMPPRSYRWLHPRARLKTAEKDAILSWLDTQEHLLILPFTVRFRDPQTQEDVLIVSGDKEGNLLLDNRISLRRVEGKVYPDGRLTLQGVSRPFKLGADGRVSFLDLDSPFMVDANGDIFIGEKSAPHRHPSKSSSTLQIEAAPAARRLAGFVVAASRLLTELGPPKGAEPLSPPDPPPWL